MFRGESSPLIRVRQQLDATFLPLGSVACGISYYIVGFRVIGDAYTHAMEPNLPSSRGHASSIFMACGLGLTIGTVQAATTRYRRYRSNNRNSDPNTAQLDLRWPLTTMAGYFAWAVLVKSCFALFIPMLASLESYTTPTSEKIFPFFLIVVIHGVIIPGLATGCAQYLALSHRTVNAYLWPLVHTLGLFLAVAVPIIPSAWVAYVIAAANPESDGSYIVFMMFIGGPVWLLLAIVLGCLSLQLTHRWLFDNVFSLE